MNFRVESVFRVGGALVFGAVLVGAALYVRFDTSEHTPQSAAVGVVARGDVRTVQQTQDSDGDGYPDWEEELLGSDPHTKTTQPTTTPKTTTAPEEAYTPPDTVTGKFAEQFLEQMIRTGAGNGFTESEQAALIENSVQSLTTQTRDRLYTRADIRVSSDRTAAAVREYGNAVSSIIIRHSLNNESELLILERAIQKDDPEELRALAPIERAYANMARDLQAHEVPSVLVEEHLDLLNTLSIIRTDIALMQQAFTDPLATLVRIQRYEDDAAGLFYAFDNLRLALEARGIVYTDDEPGVFLFSLRP